MRIKITKRGIYGAKGEVAVGTELTVKEAPKGWAGRYEEVGGSSEGKKTAVTNPSSDAKPGAYAVTEKSPGWFAITQGGKEVTKSLRKDDVAGFDALSDADKAKFVEANKAE